MTATARFIRCLVQATAGILAICVIYAVIEFAAQHVLAAVVLIAVLTSILMTLNRRERQR